MTDHPAPNLFDSAAAHFRDLQATICGVFEQIEAEAAGQTEADSAQPAQFQCTPWEKGPDDLLRGGGEMRVMRGQVFEKVGVNFSNVHGMFEDKFAKEIPGALDAGGAFRACGISLVAHMANPFVPTVHMNLRRIETSIGWFGGGTDLTPFFPFDEDTAAFHAALEAACDGCRPDAYADYKKWCDDYFFLPHRGEPRGVGGIFFDNLDSGDAAADFAFVQAVGQAFLGAYPAIVRRRMAMPFTEADKDHQRVRRGRYVEFNLLYDRGTRFGFMTGGNPDAILMSMPPEVKWP